MNCLMFIVRGRPLSRASMLQPKVTCRSVYLIELVDGHIGDLAPFQLDHDAHSIFIRFVAHVGNAGEGLIVDEFRDVLDQASIY